jgi:hypothetical protein
MKKVMMRAWEIAKQAAKKFGGRAIEYIALALREAWKEIKDMVMDITDRIEELEAKGFKRWQKNGMDRMYINASALGLICTYYKTGNISNAEFRGNHISNSEGYRLKGAKTYIDLNSKRIVSDSARLAAAAADLIGVEYSYGETIIAL